MDNPILIWAALPYQTRDIVKKMLGIDFKKKTPTQLASLYDKTTKEIQDIFNEAMTQIVLSCSSEFRSSYEQLHGMRRDTSSDPFIY